MRQHVPFARAVVAGFLTSLSERQLIDAAPHHDLERGPPDPGFCFALALSVRTAYLGSLALDSRHSCQSVTLPVALQLRPQHHISYNGNA